MLVPLVAAAGVIAIAAAGFALSGVGYPAAPTQAAAGTVAKLPVTTWVFRVGALPDGLRFSYQASSTSTMTQNAGILDAQGHIVGGVSIYATTADHPEIPKNAERLDVNGRTAYRAVPIGALATGPNGAIPAPASVIWQDVSGEWVSVDPGAGLGTNGGQELTASQVLAIARAVQIAPVAADGSQTLTPPEPVKELAKFTYIPAGYVLTQAGPDGTGGGLTQPDDPAAFLSIGITVVRPSDGSDGRVGTDPPAADDQRVTHGAFIGTYSPKQGLGVSNGNVNVSIASVVAVNGKSAVSFSLDELLKILDGMTLASNLSDQSTWFDAAEAFPHS